MKILFILLMLAASWAYAEDPTSDDYHDIAATLAKCSGYWSAMLPILVMLLPLTTFGDEDSE